MQKELVLEAIYPSVKENNQEGRCMIAEGLSFVVTQGKVIEDKEFFLLILIKTQQ